MFPTVLNCRHCVINCKRLFLIRYVEPYGQRFRMAQIAIVVHRYVNSVHLYVYHVCPHPRNIRTRLDMMFAA